MTIKISSFIGINFLLVAILCNGRPSCCDTPHGTDCAILCHVMCHLTQC